MSEKFDREAWHHDYPMDYFKAMGLILSCKSDAERNEVFKTIFQVARLHIPDTLFKYYSLTEDTTQNAQKIQTLREQQVFNGLCKDMNDPFDGKAYFYRHEQIKKYIRNPAELDKPIDFASFSRISCFTELGVNSMPMWAHYAANHAGYAVAYDMRDPRNCVLSSTMFPVQYSEKRIDVTPLIEAQFQKAMETVEQTMKKGKKTVILNDLSLVFMTCLFVFIKHASWNYEKEFRNCVGVDDIKTDAIPKAIYIGAKCTDQNSHELIQVAHEIDVPIYRMSMDDYSPNYQLIPIQI